ncbi:MAG: hypothetical protein M3Y77_06340 [Actinomycetota bacterium]|nr:hypothetical protein [Actinomycetota bacterium]
MQDDIPGNAYRMPGSRRHVKLPVVDKVDAEEPSGAERTRNDRFTYLCLRTGKSSLEIGPGIGHLQPPTTDSREPSRPHPGRDAFPPILLPQLTYVNNTALLIGQVLHARIHRSTLAGQRHLGHERAEEWGQPDVGGQLALADSSPTPLLIMTSCTQKAAD